jgi:Tfp pilus assembly protein FimT
MTVVLAIAAALAGMAAVQSLTAQPSIRADGAMRVVLGQVRLARERALNERRYMRAVFLTPSTVQVVREEVTGNTTTTLSDITLENGASYALVSGLPDTPDAFGKTSAISFGTATAFRFTPDGTLIDQSGNLLNGTVFLTIPGSTRGARAITVLGSTGRIRAYKWDGKQWVLA